jgi:hypothetical protein
MYLSIVLTLAASGRHAPFIDVKKMSGFSLHSTICESRHWRQTGERQNSTRSSPTDE